MRQLTSKLAAAVLPLTLVLLITFGFATPSYGQSTKLDFDGDGKSDPCVYRDATGEWFVLPSSGNQPSPVWTPSGAGYVTQWGLSGDTLVPGDYDGDGKTDPAVYRGGTWYLKFSNGAPTFTLAFGTASDLPAIGDYDQDAKNDIGIWRASDQRFVVRQSNDLQTFTSPGSTPIPSGGTPKLARIGLKGAVPTVSGFVGYDYFGTARWRLLVTLATNVSSSGSNDGLPPGSHVSVANVALSKSGDEEVTFSNGQWGWTGSGYVSWGLAGDRATVGDYDGDGKYDFVAVRPNFPATGFTTFFARTNSNPSVSGGLTWTATTGGYYVALGVNTDRVVTP